MVKKKIFIEFFYCVVISGDVQVRKPDTTIYELFLKKCRAGANTCVFIDDIHKNLSAAQAVVMKTIHFAREAGAGDFVPDALIEGFADLESVIKNICQPIIPAHR